MFKNNVYTIHFNSFIEISGRIEWIVFKKYYNLPTSVIYPDIIYILLNIFANKISFKKEQMDYFNKNYYKSGLTP